MCNTLCPQQREYKSQNLQDLRECYGNHGEHLQRSKHDPGIAVGQDVTGLEHDGE